VDDDGFVRLLAPVRAVAEEDSGAADRKLEAFATERFDEHSELKLAAARDLKAVIVGRGDKADRDIALSLALEPLADDAALHLVAVAPGIGAVVDAEAHRQRRRVDLARWQRS